MNNFFLKMKGILRNKSLFIEKKNLKKKFSWENLLQDPSTYSDFGKGQK